MGIGRQIAEALIREHSFKPLCGDVLLMGRQTIYYSPAQILAAFEEHGIKPAINPATIELDTNTIDRLPAYKDANLITDKSLMMLFGVAKVMALDHSSYENAEIVHDLRYPLPEDLCGAADLLIDGSTLDNVFTPSMVIQNYSKLLRPGGRMLLLNAFSAYDTAYVIMPPMWFVDYFVMNGFADCRVYVMVVSEERTNTFSVDLKEVFRLRREMGRLRSPYHMVSVVFAEKSANSTNDILPIQQDYRSDAEWEIYQHNLAAMLLSQRPHLARSYNDRFFFDVAAGHRYIDTEFKAKDHAPVQALVAQLAPVLGIKRNTRLWSALARAKRALFG
jgi:hypothetical protein